jgi:hypothetical protein
MTRLEKFIEKGAYGEQAGRIAYVMRPSSLPEPLKGMAWQKVENFNFADELLESAGLKDVFKAALDKGCALVTRAR